jgi:tetratricopeptide (TPR) repeat protein
MRASYPERRSICAFWCPGALVVAVTLVTFLSALRNDFVNWDDLENFLKNPHYRGLGWANIRWMFTTVHMVHYMPVTWLTLGMDYVLWGMHPRGYHLTALLLHASNALLFYLLAYRLLTLGFAASPPTPRPEQDGVHDEEGQPSDRGLMLGAVVAALLFSVHPLRVESVAWITERRDLVAGLFSLLTVLAYLKAFDRRTGNRLHPGWLWASVGAFILALLSKSIVVGLPLVLLALDVYPLRRRRRVGLLIEKTPFLLASIAIGMVMLSVGVRRELISDLRTLGVLDRLAITAYGLCFYLLKTVVPWPLSPLYELQYPVRPLTAMYLFPAVIVVAISVALIALRRRWPAALTIWVAYVTLILPVSGLFQNGVQIAADRFTYLPCLGLALIAGAGVTWCWRGKEAGRVTPRLARLVAALSATLIVVFAALSTIQVRTWRDSETLWRHAVALNPGSPHAHFHLAGAFSLLGKHEQALAEYAEAIALAPDALNVKGLFHAALGRELQTTGDLEGAERSYTAVLRYVRDDETALNNLGVIYALRRDDRTALDMFLRVLRVAPGHDAACRNARILSLRLAVTPGELQRCPKPNARTSQRSVPLDRAAPR